MTTADDLATFYRALTSGRVLPAAQLARMKQPSTRPADQGSLGDGSGYGLGLERYDLRFGTFYGHTGGLSTSSVALADETGRRA